MPLVSHDLRCDACAVSTFDVLYTKADGPSPCPECGGARHVSWDSGRAPACSVFKPINMGYTTVHSQAEYNAELARIKARFPGKQLDISGASKSADQVSSDEAKHRHEEKLRAKGLDTKMFAELREEQKREREPTP